MAKNVSTIETARSGEVQPAPRGGGLSLFPEFERIFERFDRLLPGLAGRSLLADWPVRRELGLPFEGAMPRVDVIDREDEVVVRAELPGVEKDDIDVTMTENTVTIKASTKKELKEEKGDYYHAEIAQGSFSRTVPLPAEVEGDRAKASYKDGILEVTIPKVARAQRRTIEVK